jgi:hypothetical protein
MKTMTGITWTDDHIYTVVTREFPEEGDEPTSTSSSTEAMQVQIQPAKIADISVEANTTTTQ